MVGARIFKSKHRESERGATMLEFTLGSFVFFPTILAVIQLTYAGYQLLAMQYAVTTASREGIVMTTTDATARLNQFKTNIVNAGKRFGLTLDVSKMTFCKPGTHQAHVAALGNQLVDCCFDQRPEAYNSPECLAMSGVNTVGGSGELVQVTVNEPVPLFVSTAPITLRRTFLAKNEIYE